MNAIEKVKHQLRINFDLRTEQMMALSKGRKKGYGECEIVLIFRGNIVSRTSLCLHKLIQTRINVWNNLFLIEYNNIIQINGI